MLRWREALSRTRAMSAADAAGCRPFSCCIPLRSCYSPRARGRNLPRVDTLAARLRYSPRVRARAERSGCYVFLLACYCLARACAMCKRIAQPECASLAHARTVPGTQLCIMPKVSLARARAYCSNNSARHRLGGSTVPRAGLSVRSTLRCASHNQGQIHHTPGTALAGSTCTRIVLISTSMGKP